MTAAEACTRLNSTTANGEIAAAPQGVATAPARTPSTPQPPKATLAASERPAGGKTNEAP